MGMIDFNRDKNNRPYDDPINKKLRLWAVIFIAGAIIGIILSIALLHVLTYMAIMFIRGCIGLFAIIFVILIAALLYRINKKRIDG